VSYDLIKVLCGAKLISLTVIVKKKVCIDEKDPEFYNDYIEIIRIK